MTTVNQEPPLPPAKDTPAPAQAALEPAVAGTAAPTAAPGSIEANASPKNAAEAFPSTADHPNDPPPTATIDPNVPSSESAPTALPTNPATNPEEQAKAVKDEHPHVIEREKEKVRAAEREVKGEPPAGTVVKGIEDDRLWAMLRRFDIVRLPFRAEIQPRSLLLT